MKGWFLVGVFSAVGNRLGGSEAPAELEGCGNLSSGLRFLLKGGGEEEAQPKPGF